MFQPLVCSQCRTPQEGDLNEPPPPLQVNVCSTATAAQEKMARNCSYSCATPPEHIPFNADITGPGVSIHVCSFALTNIMFQVIVGFLGPAGLLIILVTAHFFIAYQPQLDPFRNPSNNSCPQPLPFCPNPVDLMVLKICRRGSSVSRWSYLETPITKVCFSHLSDLFL
jgi:hypothetical protein